MEGEPVAGAKKEPPWLPLLAPAPRISCVPTKCRARLAHRRPTLRAPGSPLPSPDADADADADASPSGSGVPPSPPREIVADEGAPAAREVSFSFVSGASAVSFENGGRDPLTGGDLPAEECEMEEGQLPGEWTGAEDSHEYSESFAEDSEPAQICNDSGDISSDSEENPAVSDGSADSPICYNSGKGPPIVGQRSSGNGKVDGKKARKHRKGKGSKKRSREKSKGKYKEVIKKRKLDATRVNDSSQPFTGRNSFNSVELRERSEKGSGIGQSKNGPAKPSSVLPTTSVVGDGPEDGEIVLESTKADNGILSSVVEAEVGLWTTDDIDDQFVAEMEKEASSKSKRGPETAERKLKRKIAKRKKRAQKERELGIRRPPRTVQTKPVRVLCTHFMKGRCAKGDQCTFSHDAIPLTKQEPCKFLMSHSCLKGDDCPYSHDLGAFPCKFFHTRGKCYDGANCKFSHEPISEEAMEKLQKRVEKEKENRISAPVFDIPTPMFSTTLPLDQDPDPLGWLTVDHGLHQASSTVGTAHHDSTRYHWRTAPVNESFSSSAIVFPVTEGTQADCDASLLPSMEAEDKSRCVPAEHGSADLGLGSPSKDHFKGESESLPAISSAAITLPFTSSSNGIWASTALQPRPGEGSNVRNVLEASIVETDRERPQENEPNVDQRLTGTFDRGAQRAPSSIYTGKSPSTVRTAVVPPLLAMGRQLGSRSLDKTAGCTRQSTVDSLLGKALSM